MKTVSLSGSLRENVGKKDAKKHRKLGKVPCVLYGGKEQTHFLAEEKDFKDIIFTPEVATIKLNIDGKEINAVLQDVQYHPVTDRILHVDFLEIFEGKKVSVAIPVILEGTAPGVMLGGKLRLKIRKMLVNGLVEDLPDQVVIDINKLSIGDSVRVMDIKNDKLSFIDHANSIVVGVFTARIIEEEEEEEEVEGEEGEEGEEGAEGAEGAATEGGEAPAAK
jgi:large subunit ribosomal protein L25